MNYCPGSIFDTLNFYSEKSDWKGLETKLRAVIWEEEIGQKENPEQIMTTIIKVCAKTSTEFIPKRKQTGKKSSRIPRHRRILMRNRTTLF